MVLQTQNDQEKQPNAPLSLEDRLIQLENSFSQIQQSNTQLEEYCRSLHSQMALLNKYKNLAIGCKVDHVKKGHSIITHGYTSCSPNHAFLQTSHVDCLTSETKIINKDNKIVSEKRAFFEMRWDKPITFNLIRVAVIPSTNTVFGYTNKFDFYTSNDDGNDNLKLIAKSSNTSFDFQEEIVGSVTTKYLKIVLFTESKVLGVSLFNLTQ